MSRDWGRDDPIADMEDSQDDPRPLLGNCEVCKCELRGSTDNYDPDDGYELEKNLLVCADCLHEFFKDRRIK